MSDSPAGGWPVGGWLVGGWLVGGWLVDTVGGAAALGMGCEIVVLAGPFAGLLDEQATAKAISGTPMPSAALVRRGTRLIRRERAAGESGVVVTVEGTIRSSMATRAPDPA